MSKRYLLDTHVLIWLLRKPARVSPSVRDALAEMESDAMVSAVSAIEIAIKRQLGRLPALPTPIRLATEAMGLRTVEVTFEDAAELETLPLHHRDPFDRLLVAQARRLGATLVTADAALAAYDVDILHP